MDEVIQDEPKAKKDPLGLAGVEHWLVPPDERPREKPVYVYTSSISNDPKFNDR